MHIVDGILLGNPRQIPQTATAFSSFVRNMRTACAQECVPKTLACRGLLSEGKKYTPKTASGQKLTLGKRPKSVFRHFRVLNFWVSGVQGGQHFDNRSSYPKYLLRPKKCLERNFPLRGRVMILPSNHTHSFSSKSSSHGKGRHFEGKETLMSFGSQTLGGSWYHNVRLRRSVRSNYKFLADSFA